MEHDLVVVLQTFGGLGGSVLVAWIVIATVRAWKSPKRLDRLEASQPKELEALVLIIDILIITLKCQQGQECNGDLETAQESAETIRKGLVKFLSKQSVSQKGGAAA